MPSQSMFLLILSLKYEIEDSERVAKTVRWAVKRWCKPVMHGKRHLGYLILTNEPAQSLVDRLRDALTDNAIDNWWCVPTGTDIACKYGGADPLPLRAAEAVQRIREVPDPKDVRNPNAAQVFKFFGVNDRERRTAVKMAFKDPRKRQSPCDPDRP